MMHRKKSATTVTIPVIPADIAERLLSCSKHLNISFNDPQLLKQALSHSSYTGGQLSSNERLEFLGDAVLGMIVSQHLYTIHPDLREGKLTELKSQIVCRESLAAASHRLDIEQFLFLGRGIKSAKELPESILADAFEAIIAALYLDGGLEIASAFVHNHLIGAITPAEDPSASGNYKSILQEHLQKAGIEPPTYQVEREEGPEHQKVFHVAVSIDSSVAGHGHGLSKKEAEQAAAKEALSDLPPLDENPTDS